MRWDTAEVALAEAPPLLSPARGGEFDYLIPAWAGSEWRMEGRGVNGEWRGGELPDGAWRGGEVVQKKGDEAMFFQDKMVYLQYQKLSLKTKAVSRWDPS